MPMAGFAPNNFEGVLEMLTIERVLQFYPDTDLLGKLIQHFQMMTQFSLLEALPVIGPIDTLWLLRAAAPLELQQKIAFLLAKLVLPIFERELPDDRRALDLFNNCRRMLSGAGDVLRYRECLEGLTQLEPSYRERPQMACTLMAITSAACVVDEPLAADCVWLTGKHVEIALGNVEPIKWVLEKELSR